MKLLGTILKWVIGFILVVFLIKSCVGITYFVENADVVMEDGTTLRKHWDDGKKEMKEAFDRGFNKE